MNTVERPSTSASLLQLVTKGDQSAWARLTTLYGPIVFHACRSKGLAEVDARDVTQEVFVAVHAGLKKFKKTKANHSFLRWVNGIVRHKIADHFAAQEKRPTVLGGSEGQDLFAKRSNDVSEHSEIELSQMHQHVVTKILQLMQQDFETKTWKAFYITMVEGRSTREASEELKMTTGAIRVARMRVRKRLEEEFGDLI